MDASISRVAALAADQNGLVTRAQLVDLGRTKHQIDHAVSTQRLSLVLPGVYRMAGSPLTSDCALSAALLLTGAVASHRSAAHLLGLIDARPSSPEVTVPPIQCQQKPGLIVHRSADLALSDICRIRGLRCTTATRTLIDLGAVTSGAVLESALERALHQRLTTVARLRARLAQVARQGRPGVAPLRRVLDLRTPTLAAAESELELLLWQILRRHRLPLPERQVKVTLGELVPRQVSPAAKPPIRCGGAAQVGPNAPEQAGWRRVGSFAFHLAAGPPVGGGRRRGRANRSHHAAQASVKLC